MKASSRIVQAGAEPGAAWVPIRALFFSTNSLAFEALSQQVMMVNELGAAGSRSTIADFVPPPARTDLDAFQASCHFSKLSTFIFEITAVMFVSMGVCVRDWTVSIFHGRDGRREWGIREPALR